MFWPRRNSILGKKLMRCKSFPYLHACLSSFTFTSRITRQTLQWSKQTCYPLTIPPCGELATTASGGGVMNQEHDSLSRIPLTCGPWGPCAPWSPFSPRSPYMFKENPHYIFWSCSTECINYPKLCHLLSRTSWWSRRAICSLFTLQNSRKPWNPAHNHEVGTQIKS